MSQLQITLSARIAEATHAVFGDSPLTLSVRQVCERYENDVSNIQSGRGIGAMLIAVVGAKSQGKTWIARTFVLNDSVRQQLKTGDLLDDATTRLVWIGPVLPERLDAASEIYHACAANEMLTLGQPYVLLDTPGLTDADPRASQLAQEALSLAPLKILAIARDQVRAAANMVIAQQIDGSVCIPVITSVEPDELGDGPTSAALKSDLRTLRDQLGLLAPHSTLTSEILVPDFEVTGDEAAAGKVLQGEILDRISNLGISHTLLGDAKQRRLQSAADRLRGEVAKLIGSELPQLSDAVGQLNREAQQLPSRVLDSLLGSQDVLETGVRMRLRTRLASDTSMIWFPYRTTLSTLNLTQGAWDRVMLALSGSVPSLFGALTSWAKNVRQNREFSAQLQDGFRQRTQQQVEERLLPLCDQFHRAVMKLRPREERLIPTSEATRVRLTGIEELQMQSQAIFEDAIKRHSTARWLVQFWGALGTAVFWAFMAAPVVVLYEEYFRATWSVWSGSEAHLENFPHPQPGLFLTSLFLSILPLAIYCMLVLTWNLSRRRMQRIAAEILGQHEQAIRELQDSKVIRLQFEDELLQQAEYLLNLKS